MQPYWLVQKHPKLSFHLAAADLINWEMEAFSLLRKDFYRLGGAVYKLNSV